MIVLVGGEKGGTGKTTLAVNLAARRALDGHDVLLVDCDYQASANLWAGIRQEEDIKPAVACVQKTGKHLAEAVRDLATRYGDIILDAGGQDSPELRSALVVADLAVFPSQASLFDVATLSKLDDLVLQAQSFKPDLVAGVVINRASPNPRVVEASEAQELVVDYPNLHLMEAMIRDRIAFRRAIRNGRCVCELKDRDRLAENELMELYREVYGG